MPFSPAGSETKNLLLGNCPAGFVQSMLLEWVVDIVSASLELIAIRGPGQTLLRR